MAWCVACLLPPAPAPAQQAGYQLVVLISVDGLHEADVRDPRLAADIPTIRQLMAAGVSFTDARASAPSDSLPGTLAYLTGARPATTGIAYDDTFDRTLTPPGETGGARGSAVELTADIDRDPTRLDGGGDAAAGSIDPAKLPQRCAGSRCVPLWPHGYLRTNTLFDVLSAHRMRSVLVEKHPAYVVAFAHRDPYVRFYAPEIDAPVAIENGRLVDRTTAHDAALALRPVGSDEASAEAYDELKVRAVVNALAGRAMRPNDSAGPPSLVAFNLQAVNLAEKASRGGMAADGRPSRRLREALRYDDRAVGRIRAALLGGVMARRSLLIVFAKHGEAPRLGRGHLVAKSTLLAPLQRAGIGVAHLTADDVALLWLEHPADATRAARILRGQGRILTGAGLHSLVSLPSRTPDLVLLPPAGTIFVSHPSTATKRSEHGGFSPDDRDVPLIAWSSRIASASGGRRIVSAVSTRQIAPTVLVALGLDPRELRGVRADRTSTLPGLRLP